MTSQTFVFVPRKAWPALTQFAPDRFPRLQSLFDTLEHGSEDMKYVRAELEKLVREFQNWGVAFLRRQREVELIASGWKAQIQRNLAGEYWAKHFEFLIKADLTITEKERLMRHASKHTDWPVKPVEDALKALDKPWKYRNPKYNQQSQG